MEWTEGGPANGLTAVHSTATAGIGYLERPAIGTKTLLFGEKSKLPTSGPRKVQSPVPAAAAPAPVAAPAMEHPTLTQGGESFSTGEDHPQNGQQCCSDNHVQVDMLYVIIVL